MTRPEPPPLPPSPPTEGIKYAGSKRMLLPFILELVRRTGARHVFDGFTGTSRVAQAFARTGHRVTANDTAVWSEVFASCYLRNREEPQRYAGLIDHLNAVPPNAGWFTEHYGGDDRPNGEKRPFRRHNTMKLDAVRDEIDRLSLSPAEKAVALTSLMLALDKVDSTLGHFSSYLRAWSPRSRRHLVLQLPALFPNDQEHAVHRADALSLASQVEADLAYYDPPYGSNNDKMPPSRVRYAAYYHFWTTVCLNDRPALFGRVNRRADSADTAAASPFEEFRKDATGRFLVIGALDRLILATRTPWIVLSYSTGGRATADQVRELLSAHGTVEEVVSVDHRRNVMAGMRWTHEWARELSAPNRELLFLLRKR